MEEVLKIKKLMETDRPEKWESLPDIDLYMDQVVSYLTRQTAGGKTPAITSAMINNYVKDELLPRACGKRYHREHIAYLTAIGQLKNVLTLKDMKLLLDQQVQEGQEEQFYGELLEQIDRAFLGVNSAISPELTEAELSEMAMSLALSACAAKTACESLLAVIRRRQEDQEKENKPEKKPDKKTRK